MAGNYIVSVVFGDRSVQVKGDVLLLTMHLYMYSAHNYTHHGMIPELNHLP